MTKRKHLQDHLEDLFSDLATPEPQIAGEPLLEPAGDEVLNGLTEPPPPDAPPPEPPAEPLDAGPTALEEMPRDEEYAEAPPETHAREKHLIRRYLPNSTWFRRSSLGRTLIIAFLAAAILPSLVITVFGVISQVSSVRPGARFSLTAIVGGILVVALFAIILTALLARRMAQHIAQPVEEITRAARQMMAGDLNQSVVVNRTDEIGTLGEAFNHMADQLRTTIFELEGEGAERTRQLRQAIYQYQRHAVQLETSAEISRAAASILDPQTLMQTTVDLIRDRFGFYHASIFLTDDAREWAVVAASTGEIGRLMVTQSHRLRIGSESMVGWVCAHRQPRIASDVGADTVHFENPLLPHTRSEMALPLLVGDTILGALDVQSDKEAAFDDDDVRSLQGMADLIAISLENARRFSETQRGARHQRLAARISNRLQRASSVDDMLALTVRELGEAFDLAEVTIVLGTRAELESAENGREANVSKGSDGSSF